MGLGRHPTVPIYLQITEFKKTEANQSRFDQLTIKESSKLPTLVGGY